MKSNNNLLFSKSLSQQQRLFKILKVNDVSLDNLDSLDLIKSCKRLSEVIDFGCFFPVEETQQKVLVGYLEDIQRQLDELGGERSASDLTDFKEERPLLEMANSSLDLKGANIQPHMQLFLVFLNLLKSSQRGFNQLPVRQMNFYYEQVLKFQQKVAQPDSVYLTFELDKGVEHCHLQKGCLLSAPGSEGEQPLYYALDHSLDVNQAKISQIRQVAAGSQNVVVQYDAATDRSLPPFHLIGKDESGPESALSEQVESQYSMATLYLSSILLYLAEGVRVITIDLGVDIDNSPIPLDNIAISTELGWRTIPFVCERGENNAEVAEDSIHAYLHLEGSMLRVTLDKAFPAITLLPSDTQVFDHPVIRLEPKRGEALNLSEVTLSVEVTGLTNLILQNEQGSVNNQTSFEIFGFEPTVGACFNFANKEICSKALYELMLNTEWVQGSVPNTDRYDNTEGGNATLSCPDINLIYKYYPADANITNTGAYKTIGETHYPERSKKTGDYISTFKVQLSLCTNRGQSQRIDDGELFSPLRFSCTGQNITPELNIGTNESQSDLFNVDTLQSTQANQWPIYYQLTLSEGGFLYPQYLIASNCQSDISARLNTSNSLLAAYTTEKAVLEAQDDNLIVVAEISDRIEQLESEIASLQTKLGIVYPPYTPTLRPLSLNYVTQAEVCRLQSVNETGQLQKVADKTGIDLSSSERAAQILIKLTEVKRNQSVSLLLKTESYYSEGQAQSSTRQFTHSEAEQPPKIEWEYFSKSAKKWCATSPLSSDVSPSYDTRILLFKLTDELEDDELWLKASITEFDYWPVTQLVYIHTQAAKATHVLPKQDQGKARHLHSTLSANRINNFVVEQPEISQISQPFASFSGRPEQTKQQLAVVASERLSHRNRALTVSDYETLILAQFPQIEEVCCLTATQTGCAGAITLSVILKRDHDEMEKALSFPLADYHLLQSVKQYTEQHCSPMVDVYVFNALLVPVAVDIDLEFIDKSHEHQLIADIQQWLSAQLLNQNYMPSFNSRLDRASLLRALVQMPYVKKVTKLNVRKTNAGTSPQFFTIMGSKLKANMFASAYIPGDISYHTINQKT